MMARRLYFKCTIQHDGGYHTLDPTLQAIAKTLPSHVGQVIAASKDLRRLPVKLTYINIIIFFLQ